MTTTVTVKPLAFENPAWAAAQAKPGEDVGLSVTAKNLEAGLEVWFEISGPGGKIDALKGKVEGDQGKATWKAPNPSGTAQFTFDAVLRQIPTPANGHLTVRRRLTSGQLTVQGYRVSLGDTDAAFVPKQEKLSAKVNVVDAGGAAKAGRYEIWGERYPSDKPLYTEDFAPAAGEITWNTWDGKANDGVLNGKYLSPEHSPYRLRVIIGPDAEAVKDPYGKGKGRVSIAEKQVEVRIESLHIRLQAGLAAATTTRLDDALGIEPRAADGSFTAAGRLPAATETCRLRIPCERHTLMTDSLDQGGDTVAGAYFSAGATKWSRDSGLYSRPELPIEFEVRLRSRDATKNAAPQLGLHEPEAVGPLRVEPFADDDYPTAELAAAGNYPTYWRNAAHKVKRGAHTAPVNAGGQPIFGFWQGRYTIAADGDRDIDLTAQDAGFTYRLGSNELTVYLNRTKLRVGAAGAANVDVEEVDATHIRLAEDLTHANDVVWVMRNDSAAAGANAIARWSAFPPGANCHEHYGGVRGAAPNNLFLDRWSAAPAAPRAIIGRDTAAYPYTANVRLDPDGVAAARERVETVALTSGTKIGLAGILFSPSHVAGDRYVLGAQIAAAPYDRTLGFITKKPRLVTRLGHLVIWRVMTITRSLRMPDVATAGLPAGVGSPAETAIAARAYRGDGVNMDMGAMNTELESGFNEWVVPPVAAPAVDVHQDVVLVNYRNGHNGAAAVAGAGAVNIAADASITNQLVQFDHYRVQLPPGTPAGRRQAITAAVNALPRGTTSLAAMAAASGALAGAAQPAGGTPVFPGNAIGYFNWLLGVTMSIGNGILDALTPQDPAPRAMSVVRWPDFYQVNTWNNGAPVGGAYTNANNTTSMHLLGFCRGHGQSFFATVSGTPDTFSHEMGHSLHIVHFAAMNFGWKHHDLTSPDCKMSYSFTHGYIPQPAGAVGPVGAGAAEDTGWPDTMPAAIPGGSPTPTGYAAGNPTIEITVLAKGARAAMPLGTFCGKCMLKMRGWKEDVLPSAWRHPDLF